MLKKLKALVSLLISLGLIAIIGAGLLFLHLRAQALPVSYTPQTSQIYDTKGALIDRFYHGENRQVVSLEEISPDLIHATLAIEDHRFYSHDGFDLRGISRAVWVNVSHFDKLQGASTLTQQLARNLYLNHDRTWSRKFKEALFTVQLEMQFSKDEILEKYLNEIYYGHSTYGIEAAARLYFNKSAAELSLAESALLAGVPKGPAYYSPYLNEENARQRQSIVLQAMAAQGYITSDEVKAAYAEELHFQPMADRHISQAPYFRDYIVNEAAELLQIDEVTLKEGGYRIFTTLDLQAQRIAEQTIQRHLSESELQAALIAIDPRNGHIKAMVGGKDYRESQFNRVFSDSRQPGSAFKPFVYLTALQDPAFRPTLQFKSEPTSFVFDEGRATYTPSNFNNRYPFDFIDMREAIAHSDNIYAVHTLMQIGPEKVVRMAQRLGIKSELKPLPSLALGTFPVSPYDMAAAFAVIANQGKRIEPFAILRIEAAGGKLLYEAKPASEQVVEPPFTYVLTHMMEGVFEPGGTGARVASTMKRAVAGKTGTTNTDAWMVGFTPELTAAVWVGHDRTRRISAAESHTAAPIFAEFIESTLEAVPPKIFPLPDQVVKVYIDEESGLLAASGCENIRLEAFVKGTEPVEYCPAHALEELPENDPAEASQDSTWWEDFRRWWTE